MAPPTSESLHRIAELLAEQSRLLRDLGETISDNATNAAKIDELIRLQNAESVVLATLKHEIAAAVRSDVSREVSTALNAAKVAAMAAGGEEEREERRDVTGKHALVLGDEGVAISFAWLRKALPYIAPLVTGALGWLGHHIVTRHP